MPVGQNNSNNLESVENILLEVEEKLKEAISLSLEEVSNMPHMEKELFSLWKKHANILSDYLIRNAEKTGNSAIGKKLFKYAMFKKF